MVECARAFLASFDYCNKGGYYICLILRLLIWNSSFFHIFLPKYFMNYTRNLIFRKKNVSKNILPLLSLWTKKTIHSHEHKKEKSFFVGRKETKCQSL